ncbi:MAG TPA: condensation domain-containing protein, partial [Anaerolineae bacterium]|nr:condensation domain-containing protein [Anaerolineae bacterium]
LPLSFAQQRLWFLDQLEPGTASYNVPDRLRLRGALDVTALERSLNEVVRRHEVLRTTFPTVDGRPAQAITPAPALALPLIDLQHLPGAEREAEAARLAAEEAARPFDLARGPLGRATLLRLAPEEHVVLLTLHHIVCDEWSSGVVVQEVAALYQAFTAGRPSPLAELPIQYADYACWQRSWLQGEVLEEQLTYWKQQLAGLVPLELPADHPRPAVPGFQGGYQAFALPPALLDGLRDLCRREGATLFMALLAGFQALLGRYSGQDDIAVGSPVANRNRAETEGLIGFFVNTLVLRSDLSGDPSFRELVRRTREAALGAYAHQDVPFDMVVDALQPARDLSRTPLFQVMLVLQNTPARALELPGLVLRGEPVYSGAAKFDLTMTLVETEQGLAGTLEYRRDLYDAATIARLAGHFQALLEGAVADPGQAISGLPLLTEGERRQFALWNDSAAAAPASTIHGLFEAQARRTPEAIALACGSEQVGYRELNRRANQLAHHLQRQGVAPKALIGLCVERSVAGIVALLGILKAGGAYVPLDPAYPAERLAFMCDDAKLGLIVTQARLAARLPATARPIAIDEGWGAIAGESGDDPESTSGPDDLAYVIYTSGSTGRPKGVLVVHRGVSNLTHAIIRLFELAEGSRVLQFASLSFDASVTEVFGALAAGATLCLGRGEGLPSLDELHTLLRDEAISVVTLPPSLLALLPAEGLPALRIVISAGEACTWEIVRRWGVGRRFLNGYGPTEASVSVSFHEARADEAAPGGVPIGR